MKADDIRGIKKVPHSNDVRPGQTPSTEAEDLFQMANLSPKRTGLPFVVWICQKGVAQNDLCVKVSPGLKALSSEFVSVTVRPDVRVVGPGSISANHLRLLQKWIELNRDVLVRYWDGEIEFTEDAIAKLKSLT